MKKNPYETLAATSLSFVVRMWLEEVAADTQEALWRGQVKHVLSGQSLYFQEMADLVAFIERHMREAHPTNESLHDNS